MNEEIPVEYWLTKDGKTIKFVRYEEIQRLNNIINELEKWLKEENYKDEDFWCINSVEVLDKLKELKGEEK